MGPEPRRPEEIDPLASEILEELRGSPAAEEIVLGGYFALKHWLDYRATHDLDAWWGTGRSEAAMRAIREAIETVAGRHGLGTREREWGETVSFDLVDEGRRVFSVQIAVRSIEIEPSIESPWPPIRLESLADNLGAKMNALVQRGAARDFLDVREVVTGGLASVESCWELWSRKSPGRSVETARANALRHLHALEQRRPLESIDDPDARTAAREARAWIRATLLGVPPDPDEQADVHRP